MKETGFLASFDRMYNRFVDWCVAKENADGSNKQVGTSTAQYMPVVNSPGITETVIGIFNEMFPEEHFPALNRLLHSEAQYTPLGSIRTLAEAKLLKSVRDMPQYMENPSEGLTGTRWSRISYTMWVLYDQDDNGFVVTPKPTSGKFTCGPNILEYNYPIDEMPWDAKRAIKITFGTRCFESELRGVRFEHYVR